MKSNTSATDQSHPLFPHWQVAATPGAMDIRDRTGTNVRPLLLRHRNGDFGRVRATVDALVTGQRVLPGEY